jgi:pimeloyl-ACP methyl ester carboxylesterase
MRETVVFLPGLMCDARLFGPQIADLSRERGVLVAPTTEGERIEEIASGLLDAMPRRFALTGHGMGGMVAMEILRRAPERISRLALLSTHPLAETPQQAAERDPRIIRARTGRLAEALAQDIPPQAVAESGWRGEIMALLKDMAQGLGPEAYVRQSRALQRRRDQQATLRRVAVPTLVLCGEADPVTPVKRHSFMADLIPGAVLRVLPGVGHYPSLEAPDATAQALRDWLVEPLVLR